MNFDEEEILNVVREGGRVRTRQGATPATAQPDKPSEIQQVVGEIRKLAVAISAVAQRKAPEVTVEPPDIKVGGPTVNIPAQPREWECEVTERDRDGRMKKFRFKAITK